MSVASLVSRLTDYYGRHGLRATVRRAALAVRRTLSSNGIVLLYCDFGEETWPLVGRLGSLIVEEKRSGAELNSEDLLGMTSFWHSKLASRNINERFALGAVLWLIKSEGRLAGYGWTLRGCTMEPHLLPSGPA